MIVPYTRSLAQTVKTLVKKAMETWSNMQTLGLVEENRGIDVPVQESRDYIELI